MEMPIDDSRESTPMSREEVVETLKTMVFGVQAFERFNAKEREVLDKSWNLINQYENRLKADMVAMLTEIQLEIEEQKRDELSYQQTWNYPLNVCVSIIQQKIDKLKETK